MKVEFCPNCGSPSLSKQRVKGVNLAQGVIFCKACQCTSFVQPLIDYSQTEKALQALVDQAQELGMGY